MTFLYFGFWLESGGCSHDVEGTARVLPQVLVLSLVLGSCASSCALATAAEAPEPSHRASNVSPESFIAQVEIPMFLSHVRSYLVQLCSCQGKVFFPPVPRSAKVRQS